LLLNTIKKMIRHSGILALLILAIGFFSCKDQERTATINFYLTDAPARFQHIYIEFANIEVQYFGDGKNKSGWIPVSLMHAKTYDILRYQNGRDTLLASVNIPEGRIRNVRVKLGANNSAFIDGQKIPLNITGGGSSTINIEFQMDVKDGELRKVYLDFDGGRSVKRIPGSNTFFLRPSIRLYEKQNTGALQGIAFPMEAYPVVIARSMSDSAAVFPDWDGRFTINGLKEGLYTITAIPIEPWLPTIKDSIFVPVGNPIWIDSLKVFQ
jgi:hypothetical protein